MSRIPISPLTQTYDGNRFTPDGISSVVGDCIASVENTGLDGSGSLVSLVEAYDSPVRIDLIRAKSAVAMSSSNMVRIFKRNRNGTLKLYAELDLAGANSSASTPTSEDEYAPTVSLTLLTGEGLFVSVHVGEAINVFAMGSRM
jgi:hypothetical protein